MPQETVDSASIFLFTLFVKDQTLSRSNSEEIRKLLGPFPASAASDACQSVKRIIDLLPEDWNLTTDEDLTEQHLVGEFGHNILYKYDETEHSLQLESSGYDTLSEDEVEQSDFQRSKMMSGLFQSHCQPHVSVTLADEEVGKFTQHEYTGEWLKEQCQSSCRKQADRGFEWKELYGGVFEVLSSPEDNSAIQNSVSTIFHDQC